MNDLTDLEKLLIQVRRIEEHREKDFEKKIRTVYQRLLKDLRYFLSDVYSQYAEEDKLNIAILQQHGAYARFLEEVEQRVSSISAETKRLMRSTVEQAYETIYNGMISCVQKATEGIAELTGLANCTPEVLKRAMENPISGLTLNDTLEKHRKEVVYDIKKELNVGLMNGDRFSTMAKRMKTTFNGDYKKSIRIVRTETHRVREAGNHDAAQEVNKAMEDSKIEMVKTWRTMKDERVRPAKAKGRNKKYNHKKMEGVTIPVDEFFILPSGAKTKAPGQSGVAGEDINCRCYLSYGIREKGGKDES